MKILTLICGLSMTLCLFSSCTKKAVAQQPWTCSECGCAEDAGCGCKPDECKCIGHDHSSTEKSGCHCGPECKTPSST